MKTHCYTVLLLTIFWVIQGTGLLMGEDQKELSIEDRVPSFYRDGSDGTRRYHRLEAHGDYSQLKLIVRLRKMDYNLGERVNIQFLVRNDSDSEVHIWLSNSIQNCTHLWKLFHSNYDDATKTPKMEELIIQNRKRVQSGLNRLPPLFGGPPRFIKLQPGQEAGQGGLCLNDYFDLSKPDTYELTCFTESFIYGQEYQPPLQSNTLTFRVLENPSQETMNARESPNIPYRNPPPSEEVFKQPKPPENVFYESSTGKILDVSPYTYYRERAKEQETQATKLPDAAKPPAE